MEKLKALVRLEESLAKLPSVGRRSAERMAYAMLNMEDDDLAEFSDAIISLKKSIHVCPICGFLTDEENCVICNDKDRDQDVLMIVSYPKDVIAFENAESYRGQYHVLGGILSALDGITPEDLNIESLFTRLSKGQVKEVILALPATIDGQITNHYLLSRLKEYPLKVTTLAQGLPLGAELDYMDEGTIQLALSARKEI